MKRAIIIILIVASLVILGYFGYQRYIGVRANAASNFQTVTLTRGDLTASVGATGTVRSNHTSILAWQLSAKVEEITVAVGDTVAVGQELAKLEEKSLPQAVILARADLVTARRNLEQLQISDVASAKANQALVAAHKELEDALKKRESKNYSRALPATVDEARANVIIAEDAVSNAEKLYDRMNDRSQDDPIRAEAFAQLAKARKNYDTQVANLNWLLGRPDDQEVSEADARVLLAQANLDDAQREWDRLKSGADPEDISAAQARITGLEATLEQIKMEAPFAGTITEVNAKVGDQTAPGTQAFRIDDLSRLLVDVQITEVDINRIRVGQPVTMTFDAVLEKEYSGQVTDVARVGTPAQGVVNFTVTVEISNADAAVRPGMTAGVNIITDLVENALLMPNRAVRLREGQRIVYVLRNGAPVATKIELGLTSDTQSEMIGGDVKEGEQLILNPPVQFQPGGGGPGRGPGAGSSE
jgi:HlyD family secretion protein